MLTTAHVQNWQGWMAQWLQVAPCIAGHNLLNGTGRDAEHLRKFSPVCACGLERTDRANLVFCKNRPAIMCASAIGSVAASFGTFVLRVVGMGTKKQMRGINTGRRIAAMTNERIIRDWTIG